MLAGGVGLVLKRGADLTKTRLETVQQQRDDMRHNTWRGLAAAGATTLAMLGLLPAAGLCASIDVSQSTVQAQVAKAFPKEKAGIEISQPVITLEGTTSVAVLCGRWQYQPKVLERVTDRSPEGRFCAESGLKWDRDAAAVSLTSVRIRSLTLGTDQAVPPVVLKVLNATLPSLLEGVVVYNAPKLIGKVVKTLRVLEGLLRVEM